MIKIRIKGKPDRIEGFLIWGHAGYAKKGGDVVCAGVSAVATAALMALAERFPGDVRCRVLSRGLMYCRIGKGISEADARDARIILTTMASGLEAIRRNYGAFIDFAYRR